MNPHYRFSLALGKAIPMPRFVPLGMVRVMGAREVVDAIGARLRPQRTVPLWARVIGNVAEVGALGIAAATQRIRTVSLGSVILGVVGLTALDIAAVHRARTRTYAAPAMSF